MHNHQLASLCFDNF